MYQQREAVEMNPMRQLLNAPVALQPTGRVFSTMDVVQQQKISESRIIGQIMRNAQGEINKVGLICARLLDTMTMQTQVIVAYGVSSTDRAVSGTCSKCLVVSGM